MRAVQSFYTLNRGIVDRRGLARLDVKRLQIAAEEQTNWMPKVLGPMTLRPGMGYIGATKGNARERLLKHIFSTDDWSIVELTGSWMRIWIDDELLTRPAVTAAITNPDFETDLTGWTDMDAGSAASTWAGGYMILTGTGTARAIREQQVTVNEPDVEHALRIVVGRGPVMLRVGSTSGGDDYISETALETGQHSLSFTPTGNFYIRFFNSLARSIYVQSCDIEEAGVVSIPTPWGLDVLQGLRYEQSGDVLYVACAGIQQRKIERRGTRPGARSWSVALYRSPDGPFDVENVSSTTLTPGGITGNTTLTASDDLFKASHVGALFALSSTGQTVTVSASADDTWSSSIRVTGIDTQREVTFTVDGTFVATVTVQRSFDNGTWVDVPALSFTSPTTHVYDDTLDNAIAYYRIGVKSGDYTSGTAVCGASIEQGSIRGVVRVTDYSSPTSVSVEVLSDLGGTDATSIWQEGKWSDLRGWPMSVVIHEGRLWWAGINGIWGSISDAYDSFDETFLGDAGPMNRTIGSGPVDTINWLLSLKALVIGAQGSELAARASSSDEILTPTSFNLKASSTHGSGAVDPVKIDRSGYFVDRTNSRVLELSFDLREYDYALSDLMELCPEIALEGIVRMDVQRKPDTRIHAVLSDGTVIVIVLNRKEEVVAPFKVQTDGVIEDVVVFPAASGELDDQVYYVVKRTIDGHTVRFLEKWAQEVDCRGGALTLLADSYVTYSGGAITEIPCAHLEGEEVVVWADSADVGTDDSSTTWTQRYTVTDGVVTLDTPAANVVVGLGYEARFKSTKLGFLLQSGTSLNTMKNVSHIGLVLADTHKGGVRFGQDFTTLRDMPLIEDGTAVGEEVHEDYEGDPIPFPGSWKTDSRVCLVGQAPRPATVMCVSVNLVQT